MAILLSMIEVPSIEVFGQTRSNSLELELLGQDVELGGFESKGGVYHVGGVSSAEFFGGSTDLIEVDNVFFEGGQVTLSSLNAERVSNLKFFRNNTGDASIRLTASEITAEIHVSDEVSVNARGRNGSTSLRIDAQIPELLRFTSTNWINISLSVPSNFDCVSEETFLDFDGVGRASAISFSDNSTKTTEFSSSILSGEVSLPQLSKILPIRLGEVVSMNPKNLSIHSIELIDCGFSTTFSGTARNFEVRKFGTTVQEMPSILEWLVTNPKLLLLLGAITSAWSFLWALRHMVPKNE